MTTMMIIKMLELEAETSLAYGMEFLEQAEDKFIFKKVARDLIPGLQYPGRFSIDTRVVVSIL